MKNVFQEIWNEIPVRARYLISYGAGFISCALLIIIRLETNK